MLLERFIFTMERKGLFLDFDGTLVESLHLLKQAYDKLLNLYGKAGTLEDFHALCGPPTSVFLENIIKKYTLPATLKDVMRTHDANVRKLYKNVSPLPYAIELIKIAAAHKWIIGIVTSNNLSLIENWVHENSLEPYISFVIHGESIPKGKPSPDPYLKALDISGCSPKHSLAIEDSLTGISSSLAANIPTILTNHSLSAEKQKDLLSSFPLLKITSNLKEVLGWIQ